MKKLSRLIMLSLPVTVIISAAVLTHVFAQGSPTTEEQINRIRTNCVTVKNTLSQLHASDALLRVNRGQIYESMTTKLMSRFNSRADSNHRDAKNLVSVTDGYGIALTNFRNDYRAYEEQLSNALRIDCIKEPVSFYDSVASARVKRTQVHTDVVLLHQYIDTYKATFDAFVVKFNTTGASN